MKKKLDFRRMAAFVLCLLLCGAWAPVKASAADLEAKCTLDLYFIVENDQPLEAVEFRLYRVQELNADGTPGNYTEKFRNLDITPTDDKAAMVTTLSGLIASHNIAPDRAAKTNAEGGVSFEDLDKGVYLIQGDNKRYGNTIYTPTAILLSLPLSEDGVNWQYNVATRIKFNSFTTGGGGGEDPKPTTVQFHVLKVWEDEGNGESRPESVTVDLFRNGELYDSVALSSANNWRHDWTNLNAGYDWQVAEREVEGYTVSVSQTGTTFAATFVITNTIDEDLEDPDTPKGNKDPEETKDPEASKSPDGDGDEEGEDIPDNDTPLTNLPQTGQLWWPVPLMAMGGMVLTFLGVMRRRRWSGEDEE